MRSIHREFTKLVEGGGWDRDGKRGRRRDAERRRERRVSSDSVFFRR